MNNNTIPPTIHPECFKSETRSGFTVYYPSGFRNIQASLETLHSNLNRIRQQPYSQHLIPQYELSIKNTEYLLSLPE